MLIRSTRLVTWLPVLIGFQLLVPPANAQVPPAPIRAVRPQQREVAESRSFVGDVTPSRLSIVGSAVAGRVETVAVETGDEVVWDDESSGQVLVQLRTQTVEIEIRAAEAGVQYAQAVLDVAQLREARVKQLLDQRANSVTQEERDEAIGAVRQAEALLAQADEELARLRDLRSKYTIRAPFPGYVVQRSTEVGEWVSQGDVIAQIASLDPVEVRFTVPEVYAGRIAPGTTVHIVVASSDQTPLTGEVFRVIPQADPQSRTFPVRVRLSNPSVDGRRRLYAGMLVQASLRLGPPRNGWFVPKDAIIWNRQAAALMLALPDPASGGLVARPVAVEVGPSEGSEFEVRDPSGTLNAETLVVVEGNERLRPGQPVVLLPEATP